MGRIIRFYVIRPKDAVEVWLMNNKGFAAGCHFVNVTKGHICPCEFDNFESAIEDLNKQIKEGRVVSYARLPDMLSEPLENKDGLICQKEYENKCLAQKIQFIKELQQENAELKKQVSFLEDNLRVARKDRENLQLDVAKGLKGFVKDYPATSLRYLANEKYVEQLTNAKGIIKNLLDVAKFYNKHRDRGAIMDITPIYDAEQFLKEVSE